MPPKLFDLLRAAYILTRTQKTFPGVLGRKERDEGTSPSLESDGCDGATPAGQHVFLCHLVWPMLPLGSQFVVFLNL